MTVALTLAWHCANCIRDLPEPFCTECGRQFAAGDAEPRRLDECGCGGDGCDTRREQVRARL